jgi:hypothetical protein
MINLCAWCGKRLSRGGRGPLVSHGICPRCFAGFLQFSFDFLEQVPRAPSRAKIRKSTGNRLGSGVQELQLGFDFVTAGYQHQ